MGIDWHTARFLTHCRRSGVDFRRTLTLGRQTLFVPDSELDRMLGDLRPDDRPFASGGEFADEWLRQLGATHLVSVDASGYEGATVVHDMNEPLDVRAAPMNGPFDLVIDGGTLEHVFNFPTAIRNCMNAVAPGGHLLLQTPTNNFCGHGFYQFSPELFYRVLSPENGFRIRRLLAYECYDGSPFYEVIDPAAVRRRVELASGSRRVLLLVLAQRISDVQPFSKTPQQSDYSARWGESSGSPGVALPAAPAAPGLARRAIRRARWCIGRVVRALPLPQPEPFAARSATARDSVFSIQSQPESFKLAQLGTNRIGGE